MSDEPKAPHSSRKVLIWLLLGMIALALVVNANTPAPTKQQVDQIQRALDAMPTPTR